MKRILVAVAVSAVSLVFVMATGAGSVVSASDALTIPLDDCVRCKDNDWCPEETHDAWDTTPTSEFYARAGGAHLGEPCLTGDCDTRHGPCIEAYDEASPELFRQAILANDHQRVAKLLTLHNTKAALNAERSAIQIVGCSNSIVAHFPVGRELLDALVEDLK